MMFATSDEQRRARVEHSMAVVAKAGAAVCAYASDPERWPTGRCDCKYLGASGAGGKFSDEQTGCCELRSVYALLRAELTRAAT